MDKAAEKAHIQEHVDKGNYHAAINLSISAMNACRKTEDQLGIDEFIGVIKSIVQIMDDEFGS